MCEPVSLTIAATALAAGGQIYKGLSSAAASRYQSRLAAQNAALEQRAARDAMDRGAQAEVQQYHKTAQLIGAQRAAQASNGIETGYGSALAIQGDAAQLGAEDAQTIRDNSMREVRGFEINAANDIAKSRAAKAASTAALISTAFDVGGTILSGAKQVKQAQMA